MKTTLEKWKYREVKCNNWHLKNSIYIPLPSLEERNNLIGMKAEILSFYIDKKVCKVTFDEDQIERLNRNLNLIVDDQIRYFATPDRDTEAGSYALSDITTIDVERSSSFRSFYWQNYMIKVSLEKQKILYSHQIERAIYISTFLSKKSDKSDGLFFLKESFGCYLNDPERPYGFIVRELPEQVLNNTHSLISVVSYVSEDGNPSLMETHLKDKSEDEKSAHLKNIVESIIDTFLTAYWEYGVCLELHQQNTLLEVDANDKITGRVYYRDLDGARIDPDKVKDLGFSLDYKFSSEEAEYIFQFNKISAIKNRIAPHLKSSLIWNGLIEYSFRIFVMDSCIYLLDHFSNEQFRLSEYAIQYVNQQIARRAPETFFMETM